MKNLKMIEEHNAEEESYKLALNKFADWTKEEYRGLLGKKKTQELDHS